MDRLKLIALDADDLAVISAYLQDAVFRVGDIDFRRPARQIVLTGNRFAWEAKPVGFFRRRYERRRAVLHFNTVDAVRTVGIDRRRPGDVLSLLAITFAPDAGAEPRTGGQDGQDGQVGQARDGENAGRATSASGPGGRIALTFAGDAAIELAVECIEAQLTDLGGAWETSFRPKHPLNG